MTNPQQVTVTNTFATGAHMTGKRSWVIVSKATGQSVLEIFSSRVACSINTNGYQVISAHAWMVRINRLIKTSGGKHPSDQAFIEAMEMST